MPPVITGIPDFGAGERLHPGESVAGSSDLYVDVKANLAKVGMDPVPAKGPGCLNPGTYRFAYDMFASEPKNLIAPWGFERLLE